MSIMISGGTVTYDGAYTVATFENNGTVTVTGNAVANVEYLLIAGGGRAATPDVSYVAGGGAGGVLTGNVTLSTGSYPVVIGATGNNSSFLSMTAIGGGVGGFYGNGSAGGSGGGGGVQGTVHINFENFVGGPGTPGQGYPGGSPFGGGYPPFGPGGGGGAGGPGGLGLADSKGGDGGLGVASAVTGVVTYYAAGGSGMGPRGTGNNSPGYNNYGAGGGYSSTDDGTYGNLLPPQPGVLILRYPT